MKISYLLYGLPLSLSLLSSCSKKNDSGSVPSGNSSQTITVWDATQWASDKPNGALSAGATVSLYKTKADYAAGKPAYTATTGNDGKASFGTIAAGQYYVAASKGDISSVLNEFSELHNGAFLGHALDSPQLSKTGDFQFKDFNADGRIDEQDITELPYETFKAGDKTTGSLTLTMGYAFPPIADKKELDKLLNAVYGGSLKPFYAGFVVMDGLMSDDANQLTSPYMLASLVPFKNFTFGAGNDEIYFIWSCAWSNIGILNNILRDLPKLGLTADQQKTYTAEAKGLRGYIYLQMLTYFGGVPLHKNLGGLFPYISRSTPDQVYAAIMDDLQAAAANLPVVPTGQLDRSRLSYQAVQGLLAKAAIGHGDPANALIYGNAALNSSGQVSDAALYAWLTDPQSAETIWAPGFSYITDIISWYYNGAIPGVTVQWCPVLTWGRMKLLMGEANIGSGLLTDAYSNLKPLRIRDGLPTPNLNETELRTLMVNIQQKEHYRQGDRFFSLVRWGIAAQVLGPNGYKFNNQLLPIPQYYLNRYSGLNQNPGY